MSVIDLTPPTRRTVAIHLDLSGVCRCGYHGQERGRGDAFPVGAHELRRHQVAFQTDVVVAVEGYLDLERGRGTEDMKLGRIQTEHLNEITPQSERDCILDDHFHAQASSSLEMIERTQMSDVQNITQLCLCMNEPFQDVIGVLV